jgi:RNA polymerase sigma factor (TIGR02999 family)
MQITELLRGVHEGDPQALRALIPLVYNELKKLAAGHLRREGRAQPIETTALVHEAFLRLARGKHPSYENRSHFYGIASRLMRQILVEGSFRAEKRNVMWECNWPGFEVGRQPDESCCNDEALSGLRPDPLKAHLIEMRFWRHDG